MTPLRAVALRVGAFLATLAGSTGFVLALLLLAPGDPIDLLPNGADLRPQLEAEWGLNQPGWRRYGHYWQRVLTLNLGTSLSYRPGMPVIEVLAGPAMRSGMRIGAALLCVGVWATALAWWTAGRRTALRGWVQAISLMPVFLLAHGLVLGINETTFYLWQSGTIARPAWFALPDQPSALRATLSVVILALGSGALSEAHVRLEDALIRVRRSPYVDAARGMGAPTWGLIARNLVPPLASTLAERATFLVGGVVILEKVLLLNGAGAILWDAARLRDYDLALAAALLAAAFVGAVRLAADTTRLSIDPRLREAA